MTLDVLERLPTSTMSEQPARYALSLGRLRDQVSEPCACGTSIVAGSRAYRDVAVAVDTHNATRGHAAWRKAREATA